MLYDNNTIAQHHNTNNNLYIFLINQQINKSTNFNSGVLQAEGRLFLLWGQASRGSERQSVQVVAS